MLTALIAAAAVLSAGALEASPFAPPAKPALKIVRLLAPSGAFNARTLREFERESGFEVAYDAYGDSAKIPALMKEGPYDLVILPSPALGSGDIVGGAAQDRQGANRQRTPDRAADCGETHGLRHRRRLRARLGLVSDRPSVRCGKTAAVPGRIAEFLGCGARARRRPQARALRRGASRFARRGLHRSLAPSRHQSVQPARARREGGGRSDPSGPGGGALVDRAIRSRRSRAARSV